MEENIQTNDNPDGAITSFLIESNINLQNEVNRLKICTKMLAYALIERDLEYSLNPSVNGLTSGK